MILFAFRLLVALLTFVFGVGAAWLFGSGSSKECETVVELRSVRVVTITDSASKSRSCSLERNRVIEGGVFQTKTIDERSPAYPFYAKKVRISGTVVVRVEVDEDGKVVKAKASGGYAMLPEAAEKDALETRFAPTLGHSGEPVSVTGVILYKYVLD